MVGLNTRRGKMRRTWSQTMRRGRPFATAMTVFDRELKRKQRDWAVRQPDAEEFDYLRSEVRHRSLIPRSQTAEATHAVRQET